VLAETADAPTPRKSHLAKSVSYKRSANLRQRQPEDMFLGEKKGTAKTTSLEQ